MVKKIFRIVINDYYVKTTVSLIINGEGYQMDIKSRTGSNPYTYTFEKTLLLPAGDYVYHYEISNVWTTLITPDYYLHISETPSVKDLSIYAENDKINAWNIQLTDNTLPEQAEISFESDELLSTSTITAVLQADQTRIYEFRIISINKTDKGYSYRAISSFNLDKSVNVSVNAISSTDLVKSITQSQVFGILSEYIYLQQYTSATIRDVLQKILIINGARGYERKGKFYFTTDNTKKFELTRNDPMVVWSEDRKNLVNHLKEYYTIRQYPSNSSGFTNGDASSWTGTVSNATQTATGLLSPNRNPYILKGNGTITRAVSFALNNFDRLHLNWSSPSTSTTLTIQLTQDASNYLTYTRTFSGSSGAGFVLTSSDPNTELVKTITIGTTKYIHLIQGKMSNSCSVKAVLKLSGATVSETAFQNTNNNEFILIFDDVKCDTIELHFKGLYPTGTSYGVNCQNLQITEYAQVASGTQTFRATTWQYQWNAQAPYCAQANGGGPEYQLHFSFWADLNISLPSLSQDEQYSFEGNYVVPWKVWDGSQYNRTNLYIPVNIVVGNGQARVIIDYIYTTSTFEFWTEETPTLYVIAKKIKPSSQTNYIWQYKTWNWQSSYPMWDSIDIPFTSFTKTGNPVNITSISLTATGDNFYDELYVYASQPKAQYIEVKNDDSIRTYGEQYQEHKIDGWTSKESATLFATQFVNLFSTPAYNYQKVISWETPIELGDAVDCDGKVLYVYKIVYNFETGTKTIFVGQNTNDLLERLKQMAQKIENLERNIL